MLCWLLTGIVQTSTPDEAFYNADVAILVGSMPRREGMERADLLSKNGFIFRVQGVRHVSTGISHAACVWAVAMRTRAVCCPASGGRACLCAVVVA